MKRHILIVDDEPNILNSLERLLEENGYAVFRANSGQNGLAILAHTPEIGVVLSDQRMPHMTGIEFLRQVKTIHSAKIRMILSGYSELQTLTQAINEGSIFKFVCKPWDDEQLLASICEAFEYYELLEHNRRLSLELVETNQKLERLNSELEGRIEEKTRYLQLHIASLQIHQETLEHFPFGIVGLDSQGTVVLENEKARSLLTGGSVTAIGLPVAKALKLSYLDLLPDIHLMLTESISTFREVRHGDVAIQIHTMNVNQHAVGLLLIALPSQMKP